MKAKFRLSLTCKHRHPQQIVGAVVDRRMRWCGSRHHTLPHEARQGFSAKLASGSVLQAKLDLPAEEGEMAFGTNGTSHVKTQWRENTASRSKSPKCVWRGVQKGLRGSGHAGLRGSCELRHRNFV